MVIGCWLAVNQPVYAQEKNIKIIFTGATHGMIYPCNCPYEPDGGVSRRATLVAELRKQDPAALLVDAGNFFAGGLLDQYTQNSQLDTERTLINLKAMELMNYDCVGVGDSEFNFGVDFLISNIERSKIPFISSDISGSKFILPYILKEAKGVKIGILALTNPAARQKAGNLNFIEPNTAARRSVEELRNKGAQIIVLLSNLSDAENLMLAKDIRGLDIIISGSKTKDEPYNKAGSTILANPGWQGRKLGIMDLTLNEGKITDFKIDMQRLSDKIKDDAAVRSIMPACFTDDNCKKQGALGTCLNPGTRQASCAFEETVRINLIIVAPKDCMVCDTDKVAVALKNRFPGLSTSYLYYPESKADSLVRQLDIKALPAYLFDKNIEKEKTFDSLKEILIPRGNYYLVKPEVGGIAAFIARKKIKGKLDLFLSLYDKNAKDVLSVSKDFNPTLHFHAQEAQGVFTAPQGEREVEDCLRSVCIQEYYPGKYWDYLICRAGNINSTWWEDCLPDSDINKIKSCARGEEGKALLKDNIALNKELVIIGGTVFLMDNQSVFATQSAPKKEDLKKVLRSQ